jgi:hypothetical protein
VCFIAELLKKKDRDNKVGQDWRYIASVFDRLFLLIVFTFRLFHRERFRQFSFRQLFTHK